MSVDIETIPDLLLLIQQKLRIVQYRYGSLSFVLSGQINIRGWLVANEFVKPQLFPCIPKQFINWMQKLQPGLKEICNRKY